VRSYLDELGLNLCAYYRGVHQTQISDAADTDLPRTVLPVKMKRDAIE
jgi:hypothetical protein